MATSAAEEGLDLPACELVVRFAVATSGIQATQSMGRARARGSVYVSIVATQQDQRLHAKAGVERANMQEVLRRMHLAEAAADAAAGQG